MDDYVNEGVDKCGLSNEVEEIKYRGVVVRIWVIE